MRPLPACLLLASAYCAALASDIPPPRPVDVAAIVRRLGSEDFSQREKPVATSRHSVSMRRRRNCSRRGIHQIPRFATGRGEP